MPEVHQAGRAGADVWWRVLQALWMANLALIVSSPLWLVPPMVQTEVYEQIQAIYARAFDVTGISQMAASSEKPAGLNSGAAIRTYADIGTEYWLPTRAEWKFACRAGFSSQTVGSITGFTGVSLGFGLRYLGKSFDYAFVPLGGLGQAHRISLSYDF